MTPDDGAVGRVRALVAAEEARSDDKPAVAGWLQQLCRAAVRALPAAGVGVSLMSESGEQVAIAASDRDWLVVEELQVTLGEGPCADAFTSRRPVLAADLSEDASRRWPGYAPAALEHGVEAVFAFPLQIGAARLGVLDVYRTEPGSLTGSVLGQALTFAEVAMSTLLDGQRRAGEDHDAEALLDVLDDRPTLHQAQGMVMIQLEVSLAEAMARLRAHAYAHDRRLIDVADDIVSRRVLLERDSW